MVPLEQLGERNLLSVYYLAAEMKEELEMISEKNFKLSAYRHVTNVRYYPSDRKTRKDAILYMKEAGYLTQATIFDDTMYIVVPSQEVIFSLCIKSLAIYYQRFTKLTESQIKVDALAEEQIEKLHRILEIVAIRLSMSKVPHILYIPLQQFPGEIQQSDLLGLLYKADKDFNALRFTNIVGQKPSDQEAEIRIIDATMEKTFGEFRKAIEEKYLKITEKRKQQPVPATPPKKEPLEVKIVHGSTLALEKTEEKNPHRFPLSLPRGTKWESITIKFVDDDNVRILSQGKEHTTHYTAMGFEGKGGKPSVLWSFLRVLALYSGEIKASDSKATDKYKKQKQSLSENLESYFGIDFDPFYPFQMKGKTNKSYRVKFVLLPPDRGFAFEKKKEEPSLLGKQEKRDPFADLGDYMGEVAPSVAEAEVSKKEER